MPASETGSVLERDVRLRDLVDPSALQELCESFASLYGIAVKIFDADGDKLADGKAPSGLCAYLFTFPRGRAQCAQVVGEIKTLRVDAGRAAEPVCFSGNHYQILPIVYNHEYLGKIVFGPYFPADLKRLPDELWEIDPRVDRQRLIEYAAQYRRLTHESARRIGENLSRVLDVLLFTGHKSLLASSMHLEASTESYRELCDKNRRLQESLERLKELDRLKSNFLATISHELRTPLTSVIGYSEMLLDGLAGPLAPEQREYVATIMEKGDHLLQMITSILDVSKIESGQLKLTLSEVNLAEVVEEAFRTVVPLASKKGQTLDLVVEGTLPVMQIDREKVRQILVNLLGNAVKFTPQNGKIELWAGLGPASQVPDETDPFDPFVGQEVRVRVTDTGIGIPGDQHQKIFENFYQVDSSSTREYGGAGIGLSIAKSYAEAHGGRITVESEVGEGSVFTVHLPIRWPP
jgi:two-component system sensor histidine kinase BarA